MTDSALIAVPTLIAFVAPYALALIPVILGWGVVELRKHNLINLSDAAVAKLDTLAEAEAGAMITASETNLAGVAIPLGSKVFADAAARVIAAAPGALDDAGLTPTAVATMVSGHLGSKQASSPATAPVAVIPNSPAAAPSRT